MACQSLGIATSFEWNSELFWTHHSLAEISFAEGEFDDAHALDRTSQVTHGPNACYLGHAVFKQALTWHRQRGIEDVTSEALGAVEVFEKVGATNDLEAC